MNNIFIHIGARSGSKGLKNKNILKFKGKPLILWTILLAKKIKQNAKIIVNTDSEKIIKLAKLHEVDYVLKRPANLSNDKMSKFSAWKYACNYLSKKKLIDNKDLFLDLDCTCPLRKLSDIKKLSALQKQLSENEVRNILYNQKLNLNLKNFIKNLRKSSYIKVAQ